jgi:hypothetical protein
MDRLGALLTLLVHFYFYEKVGFGQSEIRKVVGN